MEIAESSFTYVSTFERQIAEKDDPNVLWNAQVETTSHFEVTNLASSPAFMAESERIQLQHFSTLLTRRISYLNQLKNLERGWISGGGEVPSDNAIKLSKALLSFIRNQAQLRTIKRIPRVVIGP